MTSTAAIVLSIITVAILIALGVQVSQYRHGRSIISRKQFLLRLLMAGLLLVIVGMIFIGAAVAWPKTPRGALIGIVFVTVPLILSVVVVMLAMADMRAVEREQHVRQAAIYRAMHEAQVEASRKDEG